MNLQKSSLNPLVNLPTVFARLALAGLMTVSATFAAITVGTSLSQGIVGQPYLTSLTATGGTAPYSHSLSGSNLPAGLSLASNGVLSGTPSAAGQFNFAVQTTDATNANDGRTRSYVVVVIPEGPPRCRIPPSAVSTPE